MELFLREKNFPQVVCFTKTWFTDRSVPTILGYNLFRKDRPSHGGGVCIYIKDSLTSFEVKSVLSEHGRAEQLWCGIKRGGDSVLVGCVYRPPKACSEINSEIWSSIVKAREKVEVGEFKSILVCGDFNFPSIEWVDDGSGFVQSGDEEKEFLRVIEESYLSQMVNFPTFISNFYESTLDLIFTSETERMLEIGSSSLLGSSVRGHVIIRWKFLLDCDDLKDSELERFSVFDADFNKISQDLNEIDWDSNLSGMSVNEAYSFFEKEYERIFRSNVPKKRKIERRLCSKWITNDLKILIKEKHKSWYNSKKKQG